ncbi:MAG: hypothetical protein IPP72_04020 [Chitinophagaceae bacterium]|nr:hypothetical protein [Chitinophagaceae bacterium]
MHFSHITNAALSNETDRPMMQKEVYPVSNALQQYLAHYKKDAELPLAYNELLHYDYSNAIKDANGKHTHWERVVYDKTLLKQLEQKITMLYAQLKHNKHPSTIQIQSIDFCEFANSMPFRINFIHTGTYTEDRFYIKTADASRIYGLELEQLLSHNHINFLYHQNTLVEEHIEGIPGDHFLEDFDSLTKTEKRALSEEFIRFNERCFARLLGDMRSYNFVVLKNGDAIHPFTIKAIDFDQQCYEGKLNLYVPQFYKENVQYVQTATELLDAPAIEAIRIAEREQLAQLAVKNKRKLSALLHAMLRDEIADNYKVVSLRKELNAYHHTHRFSACKTMGSIVKQQLKQLLQAHLPPPPANRTAGATI